MALTGLDIFKSLPKTNCKECGVPTCLAFAMKVASGQAGLDDCPKLTDDARSSLTEASAPAQRLVKIGSAPHLIEIGQETVLYRHEERFHHPTAVALTINDTMSEADLTQACEKFKALSFHRVGETLTSDMVALVNDSGSPDNMQAAAETIYNALGVPMVLMSDSPNTLSTVAMGPLSGGAVVLYCTGPAEVVDLVAMVKDTDAKLCVDGTIESVAGQVEKLNELGVKDILISPGKVSAGETLEFLTKSRRGTLLKKFRQLGCPVLTLAVGDDSVAAALDACAFVCKYSGIVVSNAWEGHLLAPILTTRQNIYTDPQKPVQVEPKVYDVGDVSADSPLLVTTNFSLSYYSVESEVESARVPCRIIAVDTEGTSVLTGWASDKFNPETITQAMKTAGVDQLVSHHKVVIPGHVAVIAAQLGEESGWNVLVGPKDAGGIGAYLKNDWKNV
ncbi:MAG: acetyl-CoA decarbonylase/synthase complex subunit gamma [Phycisphaerae bacterium]|nr:acetyl-CoA decarbonylase/synthase complex subunit gamma [Phycisphaerae bacterium]